MNFWQTKTIRLRAIEPGDAEYFFRWNQDSERARHIDFVWPPTSLASVQAWVEKETQRTMENDTFRWVIETQTASPDGEETWVPVGSIDTHHCDAHSGTFGYAMDVAVEHRRKGYASEAIKLVLRYYFEELRYQKATTCVHSGNEASIRLHQKMGFQLEGTHRRMVYTQGQYQDLLWFGMTAEEFAAGFPLEK